MNFKSQEAYSEFFSSFFIIFIVIRILSFKSLFCISNLLKSAHHLSFNYYEKSLVLVVFV